MTYALCVAGAWLLALVACAMLLGFGCGVWYAGIGR